MIIILATAKVGADSVEKAHEAIATMVQASNAEEGCISYAFAQELGDPHTLHAIEKWRDEAAIAEHFASPHMAAFQQAIAGLDLKIESVRKFATDEGQPLG